MTLKMWLNIKYKNMNNKKTVLIKNERELQIMKELAKVHMEVFEEIKKIAKVWVTGYDIDKLALDICNKHWVLPGFKWVYDFPANICISINDCVVHGVPSKKMVFQNGDIVKFDFWVKDKRHGLNTDAAFSMIIWDGPHDVKMIKFLQVSNEALYKWIAKAVVWNRIWDIWAAIQTHIESHWYHIIKDLTWHAIWYNLHERPYIPNFWKVWKWEILRENMTLAIEPIIWFSSWKIIDKWWFEIYVADGSPGAQFEHTIVVKQGYPEIII